MLSDEMSLAPLRSLGVDPDCLGRIGDRMACQGHRLPGLALTLGKHGMFSDFFGHLIEVVTGQSLERVMIDRLLAPLGMTETGFTPRAVQLPRLPGLFDL